MSYMHMKKFFICLSKKFTIHATLNRNLSEIFTCEYLVTSLHLYIYILPCLDRGEAVAQQPERHGRALRESRGDLRTRLQFARR